MEAHAKLHSTPADHTAHDHGHGHSHGHTIDRNADRRALWVAFAITLTFTFAEAVGGWISNSLALLADAGHMLTDSMALGLSLIAIWLARKPAQLRRTFGLYRAEILASLLNAITLLGICVWIFYQAWLRIQQPVLIQGSLMLGVSIMGLIANVLTLWVLWRSGGQSLNLRGALLHVLGDLLGSVGAIAAAAIVLTTGWSMADPLISIVIGLLILIGAWRLLAETVRVLLEIAPAHIQPKEVEDALRALPGVSEVHDVHVWTITSGMDAVSGHLRLTDDDVNAARLEQVFKSAEAALQKFKISHVTLQIEPFNHRHPPCGF